MVMIRCPECGHAALDVASRCPQCGRVLIQNPLETHGWALLIECGRCHKHISRDAVECPYCGHPVRAVRRATRAAVAVVSVAAVTVLSVLLWRGGVLAEAGHMFQSPRRAAAPPAAAARPATTPGADTAVAAAPPAGTDTTPVPAAPPATDSAPATGARSVANAPAALVTRWTADWANVRRERSVDSPPIQVLPPGQEVQVADRVRGWWVVYAGATPIGYIANSVLSETRPPGG